MINQVKPFAPIPFILPPIIKSGDPCGTGVLIIKTFVANTDTSVTHNLGIIPHFAMPLWVLDNLANPPANGVYTPKLKPSTAHAWTTTTINIEADTNCTDLLLWIV
jgi:hypothetical protein